MKTSKLETLFRAAFPQGIALKDLKNMHYADGQSMAMLYSLDMVRRNEHKKAISIPALGWFVLDAAQMLDTTFDWVGCYDSTGAGNPMLLLGHGNPYTDPQSVPLPTKGAQVMAIPFSIAKILR